MVNSEEVVIGRVSSVDYRCSCINCGAVDGLVMFPHRNEQGRVVGMVYACEECIPVVRDRRLVLLDSWGPGEE